MAKEFTKDLAELSGETTEPETVDDDKEATPVPENKAKPERKSIGYSIQEEERSSSTKLIVAAVVLISAIAGGLWSWFSGSEDNVATVNPPTTQQTQPVTEPEPIDNPTPVANANPAPTTPSDKVEVQARFNDLCWALVTVDGVVVQEGVIEGGQTISWEGKENITFRLGNAGAVEFFQGGQSLGVQGAIGDVVDRTFTKQ